jgi:hypothetical protein
VARRSGGSPTASERARIALLAGLSGAFILTAEAAPAPEEPAPFSHRRHLALPGLTCAFCHATVTASTSSADDNRPKAEVCAQCHPRTAGSSARDYGEAARPRPAAVRHFRFDHQRHLALGDPGPLIAAAIDAGTYLGDGRPLRGLLGTGDACLSCHRGMREADQVTAAHLPRMADCLVCHQPVSPPESCRTCHTAEAQLRPATHTPDFVDRHSNRTHVPDRSGCQTCHGTGFTCMGCH